MGQRNDRSRRRRNKSKQGPANAFVERKVEAEIGKIEAETDDIKKRYRLDVFKSLVTAIAAIGSLAVAIYAAFGG